MKNSIPLKMNSRAAYPHDPAYEALIKDLLAHKDIQSMAGFRHHGTISCLDHSLAVSYLAYRLAKRLNLNEHSVARAGLLHDFYLYDWHIKKNRKGLHGFTHAKTSLANADHRFQLNPMERDIIKSHMWPMNPTLPRYRESFLVCLVDKLLALAETIKLINAKPVQAIFPVVLTLYSTGG